jgi:mannose-6-phosphate isomerase-like protein (cupin superfamily)
MFPKVFGLPSWVYQKLLHLNIIDWSFLIFGVALVFRDFDAPHHFHAEDETYYFFYGTGKLLLGSEVRDVRAPAVVHIPGNTIHAMTPSSRFVILFYSFNKGPFRNIEYTYLDKKMA